MKVLAVCPTYGRIPFLNRMVASFLRQTHQDKHLVIVNDDKNVKLVCNEENVTCINLDTKMLLPQKRNLGNSFNYSDIIMPFDDDDIFMPNRMSNHVNKHIENPSLGAYCKVVSYTLYGDVFSHGVCSPTVCSYTRKCWMEVGGYKTKINAGEDQNFMGSIANKIIDSTGNELDFVYNYGNINYHASYIGDSVIENIAENQLKQLNLVGKEYVITPDYEEYDKFVELGRRYDADRKEIKVKHISFGKINIT
jgi:glycosyltransferase involved in cell wall biosynthesis